MTASLLSNKSTSQSLEASEKAESDMRPSQESGVGIESGLVAVNSAFSLSRNKAW